MPKCKNDLKSSYTGKELSPKGKGYCARKERLGTKKRGNDGKIWIVKKRIDGVKLWARVVNKKPNKNSKKKDIKKKIVKTKRYSIKGGKPPSQNPTTLPLGTLQKKNGEVFEVSMDKNRDRISWETVKKFEVKNGEIYNVSITPNETRKVLTKLPATSPLPLIISSFLIRCGSVIKSEESTSPDLDLSDTVLVDLTDDCLQKLEPNNTKSKSSKNLYEYLNLTNINIQKRAFEFKNLAVEKVCSCFHLLYDKNQLIEVIHADVTESRRIHLLADIYYKVFKLFINSGKSKLHLLPYKHNNLTNRRNKLVSINSQAIIVAIDKLLKNMNDIEIEELKNKKIVFCIEDYETLFYYITIPESILFSNNRFLQSDSLLRVLLQNVDFKNLIHIPEVVPITTSVETTLDDYEQYLLENINVTINTSRIGSLKDEHRMYSINNDLNKKKILETFNNCITILRIKYKLLDEITNNELIAEYLLIKNKLNETIETFNIERQEKITEVESLLQQLGTKIEGEGKHMESIRKTKTFLDDHLRQIKEYTVSNENLNDIQTFNELLDKFNTLLMDIKTRSRMNAQKFREIKPILNKIQIIIFGYIKNDSRHYRPKSRNDGLPSPARYGTQEVPRPEVLLSKMQQSIINSLREELGLPDDKLQEVQGIISNFSNSLQLKTEIPRVMKNEIKNNSKYPLTGYSTLDKKFEKIKKAAQKAAQKVLLSKGNSDFDPLIYYYNQILRIIPLSKGAETPLLEPILSEGKTLFITYFEKYTTLINKQIVQLRQLRDNNTQSEYSEVLDMFKTEIEALKTEIEELKTSDSTQNLKLDLEELKTNIQNLQEIENNVRSTKCNATTNANVNANAAALATANANALLTIKNPPTQINHELAQQTNISNNTSSKTIIDLTFCTDVESFKIEYDKLLITICKLNAKIFKKNLYLIIDFVQNLQFVINRDYLDNFRVTVFYHFYLQIYIGILQFFDQEKIEQMQTSIINDSNLTLYNSERVQTHIKSLFDSYQVKNILQSSRPNNNSSTDHNFTKNTVLMTKLGEIKKNTMDILEQEEEQRKLEEQDRTTEEQLFKNIVNEIINRIEEDINKYLNNELETKYKNLMSKKKEVQNEVISRLKQRKSVFKKYIGQNIAKLTKSNLEEITHKFKPLIKVVLAELNRLNLHRRTTYNNEANSNKTNIMINELFKTNSKKQEIRRKLAKALMFNTNITEVLNKKNPVYIKQVLKSHNINNNDTNNIVRWWVSHHRNTHMLKMQKQLQRKNQLKEKMKNKEESSE